MAAAAEASSLSYANDQEEDGPESLVNLCVKFCVKSPECIAKYDEAQDAYFLYHGIQIPDNISQLLFNAIINEFSISMVRDERKIRALIHVFDNPHQARVSKLYLQDLMIDKKHLKRLVAHSPSYLNVRGCRRLETSWGEVLDEYGENLTSMSLDVSQILKFIPARVTLLALFENPFQMPTVPQVPNGMYSELENDEPWGTVKCPNLINFTLNGTNKKYEIEPMALSSVVLRTVCPMKSLCQLDLTSCQLDLTLMDGLSVLKNLQVLGLHCVPVQKLCSAIKAIGGIKSLKALDLSQGKKNGIPYRELCGSHNHLKMILDSYPNLVWLDLSGTDIPQISEKLEYAEKCENPEKQETRSSGSPKCRIWELGDRQFEFLGLLNCSGAPSHCSNIPAKQVTGDHTEEQIICALHTYCDKPLLLATALCDAYNVNRFVKIQDRNKLLKALLPGLYSPNRTLRCQTVALMVMAQIKKEEYEEDVHQMSALGRKVILAILKCLQEAFYDLDTSLSSTLVKKAVILLHFFDAPNDFLFCYKEAVTTLLKLSSFEGLLDGMQGHCLYLLKKLASQVEPSQKELMGEKGIETMLRIIETKSRQDHSDETLNIAWSVIWSLTDVCPCNCERFIASNGMTIFDMCYRKFYPENMSMMKKMVRMMCNLAEVEHLRIPLMTEKNVTLYKLLLRDELNISNSVCGVLAHLIAEGKEAWNIESPSREQVMNQMQEAILSWDIQAKRNVRYRTFVPIVKLLTCYHSPVAQLWSSWEVCSMILKDPERYCPMILSEAGPLLNEVMSDERIHPKTREHLERIISMCDEYKQNHQTQTVQEQQGS